MLPKITHTVATFVEHGILAHKPCKPMTSMELRYPVIQFLIQNAIFFECPPTPPLEVKMMFMGQIGIHFLLAPSLHQGLETPVVLSVDVIYQQHTNQWIV